MKRIPKTIYPTIDEIDTRIRQREVEAMSLPPDSEGHRSIMKEIAQLRMYLGAKRWLFRPEKQHA